MSAVAAPVAASAASMVTIPPAPASGPDVLTRMAKPSKSSFAAQPKSRWSDVPFPILFVLGALFGLVFAMVVVVTSRPKAMPAVAMTTALVAPVAAPVAKPVVAAAPRIDSAPFVAWPAPPVMPTVAAEPQLHASTAAVATAPAHAGARAHGHAPKRGARGGRRASR